MLDGPVRLVIDPPLNRLGLALARRGLRADTVTLTGLALGLASALLIALGMSGLALLPLLASRLADGLDGAVARATKRTDFGAFLDITADFLFYASIPLAFVIADPVGNGLAGAILLTSFYFNGTSFLALAIMAAKRGITTSAQGVKSLYYSNGLLEGTETILFFVALCLFPQAFVPLAWGFGLLCLASGGLRVWGARQLLSDQADVAGPRPKSP